MTDVRLIDANSVCKKIAESIRHAEEWQNEAKEQQDTHGLRCATDAKISLLSMLARIHDEPTVEAEPDKDWISAKDKLPDEGENVLIYCPEFLEDIRKAFYTEGDFFIEKEDLIVRPAPNGYCTHWRHLPEPPKGE